MKSIVPALAPSLKTRGRGLVNVMILLGMMTLAARAESPMKITDLSAAMTKAKAEGKLLFLQMGTAECVNCQALRAMVAKDEVKLPESQFVYADVDGNDGAAVKVFRRHFKVLGMVYPLVVVAAPDGTQLAARFGPGTAQDYAALIARAQAKMAK